MHIKFCAARIKPFMISIVKSAVKCCQPVSIKKDPLQLLQCYAIVALVSAHVIQDIIEGIAMLSIRIAY